MTTIEKKCQSHLEAEIEEGNMSVIFSSKVRLQWNLTFFEYPSKEMKSHLKSLFIRDEVDGYIPVAKVLIDEGQP